MDLFMDFFCSFLYLLNYSKILQDILIILNCYMDSLEACILYYSKAILNEQINKQTAWNTIGIFLVSEGN